MRRKLTGAVIIALTVASAATASAQQTASRRPSAFHVVLLSASNKPGPAAEGLTPAMTKALKDAETLLPFKSYRVLDTTLLRGRNGGTTRVTGVQPGQYLLTLDAQRTTDGRGNVRDDAAYVILSLRDYYAMMNSKGEQAIPNVMQSSFDIATGETVVAGTSRVSEDAIVVLLTALAEDAIKK
jgi:hypothetical protein